MDKNMKRGLTPEKEARAQYVIEQAVAAYARGGRPAADAVIGRLLAEDWDGSRRKKDFERTVKTARSTSLSDLMGLRNFDKK